MATSTDTPISLLSPEQEQALAEIVSEHFGSALSYVEFLDQLHLLCEDIAGFEAGNLADTVARRIWNDYSRRAQ
ncbi:hypothetical protein [Cupriavidus basilensis]|uniref:hypothetical protein n=1 Tax=Cupriavidus basilensis TaxID=68895 RepID=UPI00075144BC|nr:hypothetical protein [Cupriavidus basilensis]